MLEVFQREEEISGLAFPSETGGPLDSRNIYHRDFLPCLKAAGLRRVTFQCFRHTFGSMLLQDGASLAYVKEQMRHSSIQVTVDIYGHLVPGGNIKWIDRLGSTAKMEPKRNRKPNPEPKLQAVHSKSLETWQAWRDSNPRPTD